MSDQDLFAGLAPAAVLVEASEGADGADDAIGGGANVLSLLDDVAEGVLGASEAAFKEADRVSVAVNYEAVAEIELIGEVGGPPPVKEGLLDGVTLGVVADGAVALVTGEIGLAGGSPVGGLRGGLWGGRFSRFGCRLYLDRWRDWTAGEESAGAEATFGRLGHGRVDDALGVRIEVVEVDGFGLGAGDVCRHLIFL